MSYAQVIPAVKEVVHLYNTDRPHLSLNLAAPQDVYWGHQSNVPSLTIPDGNSPTTNY
jgi:transposase InsO family protein